MKIEDPEGNLIAVYCIYWIGGKTLFLGLPVEYGGLRVYELDEVTVIDPLLPGNFIFYQNGRIQSICHEALIKEQLLNDLLDRNQTAYKRFLEILAEEKQQTLA